MNERVSWLRFHWRTALALVLIFGIALFIRAYFVYGSALTDLTQTCDGISVLPVSGGSDSYYWHRALCYSFETGKDLNFDSLLNYGLGLYNPRPPLFPWFSLLMGQMLGPLFGDAWHGVLFVFLLSTGLFGALTVLPTYLLTKEAFGRRAGLVAALLLAVSSAHLQRSQATDADHDAFTLFFVVLTFYFFLRALKVLQPRRWVENWFQRASIAAGVRSFFKESRRSVLYAALTGLSITVIALSWQGWAYVPVILIVYYAVQLFLDRVRNQDPMGLTILFAVAMIVPLVLAFPWYASRFQLRVWFDVPAYLFLAALVLGGAFTVTRDYPWTLVIPITFAAGGLGLAVGLVANPALANAFVSGAGYFVQTKVYQTIAEAQAPGLSQLILSFGFFTFYFSVAAVAYMLWQVPRRHDAAYTVIVVWAFAAIFMAMAAARFIFNASPAFAVTAAFAVDLVLRRADFEGMRRTYRSLAPGSWRNAIRKSLKIRHVLTALVLGGLVVLPNVWWGIDAGIPFELKSTYDRQVQDLLPSFLRSPGYQAGRGGYYFGAFGYSLPQEREYFPAAWQWFRGQDAGTPVEQRPAFLSWWDYGFEAVDRGQHPTVADNFQNGFNFAGQFITAQSEDQAVALLAIRSLEGDLRRNRGTFSAPTVQVLESFGLPAEDFRYALTRPAELISVVRSDPATYGVWDSEMQALNAMYIYLDVQVRDRVDAARLPDLYRAVRSATGIDIGYFAVDSRLFPISASNTGIFYAPVKLSDHRVVELPDGRTLPNEFFQVFVDTDRQSHVPLQNLGPGDSVRSQTIEYQRKFYNSMFYRAYVGYSPPDLGFGIDGPNDQANRIIPGFGQALANFPPHPAWNLAHFRVVYRTSYYNPFDDPGNHTDAWRATNYEDAQRLQSAIGRDEADGVVDLSTQATVSNGIVFVRYYDGAWVNGTILAGGATPVPGVRVTVTDELGTPHYVASSDSEGRYSTLVPFGNVTLTASVGQITPGTLNGARVLTTATFPVSLDQALRENVDEDGNGVPDWLLTRDLNIPGRAISGTLYLDLDRDGAFGGSDAGLPGATVKLTHADLGFERTFLTDADGEYALSPVPAGTYRMTVESNGHTVGGGDVSLASGLATRQDLSMPFATLSGFATDSDGRFLASAAVDILDETAGAATRVITAETGFYRARPLLAGNYTVTAASGTRASNPERVRMSVGDATLNLTLNPSGRVAGTTRLFGQTQPFATLEFQLASEVRLVRAVTSDASGAFSITLPAGTWNVNGRLYGGTSLYATLGRASVRAGEDTPFDAMFVDGARIEGTVNGTSQDGPDVKAQIAFLGASGDWWIRTGAGGGYLAFLPRGTYAVQAFSSFSAFQGVVSLTAAQRIDVSLASAASVSLRIFRDIDADGTMDPDEAIGGAAVRLVDDLGRRILAVTDSGGSLSLLGFSNRTYAGSIEASGFEPYFLNGLTITDLRSAGRFALVPLPVEIRGSVLLDGVPLLNRAVAIEARPLAAGARAATATTDSNGGFFLGLVPGRYELVVDENVSGSRDLRFQNLGTDAINVSVGGAPTVRDLAIVVRARVTGNTTRDGAAVASTVLFDGPDRRTVSSGTAGFELYLRPGTYAVSAAHSAPPDEFVFLDDLAVSGPGRHSLALIRGTRVSGLALFRNVAVQNVMPVTFARSDGGSLTRETSSTGNYAAVLVPGTYRVQVDAEASQAEGAITRFYRFTFDGALIVANGSSAVTFHLDLTRSFDNTTVSGRIARSGQGVEASLAFLARGQGALEARAAPTSGGDYSIGLAPGTYDVYATRSLGSAAFLQTVAIPHAEAFDLDIALREAFLLSGVVTDAQAARTSASLTIQAGARLDVTADASGAYESLLPAGTYTVTVTKPGVERGVSVEYRAVASVDLRSDAVSNFRLAKVERRAVSLSWDVSQRQSVSPGGSVEYSFLARNTGNVDDTYTLTGQPADWTFTFDPGTVPIKFGDAGNTTFATVTIRAPADAQVVHGPVTLKATSSDGATQGTVTVDIDVRRTRGLTLRVVTASGTFDGRSANYTLEVKNTGNDRESVTVFVSNPGDLAASGWSAAIGREGGLPPSSSRLENIAVNANSTVRLKLQLTSALGPGGVTVVLQAFLDDAPSVTATVVQTLDLPELSVPGGIQATGPNVVHTPSLPSGLVGVVLAAGLAVAAGVLLSRRRR